MSGVLVNAAIDRSELSNECAEQDEKLCTLSTGGSKELRESGKKSQAKNISMTYLELSGRSQVLSHIEYSVHMHTAQATM